MTVRNGTTAPIDDPGVRMAVLQARAERLVAEAQWCDDAQRLRSIAAEVEYLSGRMFELREEQLLAAVLTPPAPRRRWWQRPTRRSRP